MSRQFHTDPVTGDKLTNLEFATRQLQVFLRTPWFMAAFNLITFACLLLGWLVGWNTFASWLAVVVEWAVGTYMFGQTGRDATYIRRIAHLEEVNEAQMRHLEALVAHSTRDAPGLDAPQAQPRCFR